MSKRHRATQTLLESRKKLNMNKIVIFIGNWKTFVFVFHDFFLMFSAFSLVHEAQNVNLDISERKCAIFSSINTYVEKFDEM